MGASAPSSLHDPNKSRIFRKHSPFTFRKMRPLLSRSSRLSHLPENSSARRLFSTAHSVSRCVVTLVPPTLSFSFFLSFFWPLFCCTSACFCSPTRRFAAVAMSRRVRIESRRVMSRLSAASVASSTSLSSGTGYTTSWSSASRWTS